MGRTLFRNGPLLDPERAEPLTGHALLVADDGHIEAVLAPGQRGPESVRAVDLAGRRLAPGLLDVHHHGATVFDAPHGPSASLCQDAASLLRHGVTGFLPTTIALGRGELGQRVEGLARAASEVSGGAAVLGLHLEGPWINAAAPGAQPRDAIRPYDPGEGCDVLDRAAGLVRMVTLATEIEGASELVAELLRRGVVPALGHTRADAATAAAGFQRGVRHVTHLYNAMGAFHHREPGAIGAALDERRVSCDLICDGVHVHPGAVRLAAQLKGEGLLLISDAIEPPAGSTAAGEGGIGQAPLTADGPVWRLPDGTLAGSRLGLAEAVGNAVRFGAMTQCEAVAAATLRPARLLGIEAERGTLRPGARADLVALDSEGRVSATWIAGEVVWPR